MGGLTGTGTFPVTLNGRLHREGYICIGAIPDERLGSGTIANLLVDSKEKYSTIRIVPSDFAFAGSNLALRKPHHVVYAKYKKGVKHGLHVAQPGFYDTQTGEDFSTTPVSAIE